MRIARATYATTLLLAALGLGAQQAPAPAQARRQLPGEPQFDPDAVERGKQLLVARCGFCHGANARGAAGGSDLTRSAIVQEDENGKQLGEFLKVGRPERNMPKFELSEQELSDLATFLHATIYQVANRRLYQILDIVTGDAKAGEAFFSGAGGCSSCHSPQGDLKGIGAKYDPATLQGRLLLPRGGRGGGPPGRAAPPFMDANAVKATVTLPSGESFSGALVRLTDFDVTIFDAQAGQLRTWLRSDDVPRVTLTDPLQAHVDLLGKWTDADMHNMTAYLASLK